MNDRKKPTALVTGATGKVGGAVLRNLRAVDAVSIVVAVRTHAKAKAFEAAGLRTVLLDLDDEVSVEAALRGIDRAFLMTGYTVDMLRQSKVFLDKAKRAGVRQIVHLGACGDDEAAVDHWAWHQLVERYVEWCGFGFTHLRPQNFMQNLLGYGGARAVQQGVIRQYVGDARVSWVNADDVAFVAAQALLDPPEHNGKTYRLGYDAKSYGEIAAILTEAVGQPFRYEALNPEIFLENMRAAGAEMAYMRCVFQNYQRTAARQLPGVDDTFENFRAIAGREPVRWAEFARTHRSAFAY